MFNDILEFNRAAIANGELWRILSGHVVHFNLSHAAWDIATTLALALALWWIGISGRSLFRTALVAAATISASVWFLAPHLETYRGLSGITCAFFSMLLLQLLQRARARGDRILAIAVAMAALGFVAKLAYEAATGTVLFADPSGGFVPVPLAHGVGFLTPIALARFTPGQIDEDALEKAIQRNSSRRRPH